MPRDPDKTRQRILDAAQEAVLRRGFAATSIDDIQGAAGISRGTFFYHFPSKDEMARALLARYAETDRVLTEDLVARAEKLSRDPLQQVLIFLTLLEEVLTETGTAEAGCLFASYSYEAGLFDEETNSMMRASVEHLREVVGPKLAEAIRRRGTRIEEVDPHSLADLAYGIVEGGFVLSRTLGRPEIMAEHLRHLRNYLELLFGVAEEASARRS